MARLPHLRGALMQDLRRLGICAGDGLFVHGSMRAIGPVVGGARAVIEQLLQAVGDEGLIGMPGFSVDAGFPAGLDPADLDKDDIAAIEAAVPGFDPVLSPAEGMGVIAESFRTWPGTLRSPHPTSSICLRGFEAEDYAGEHTLAWATGEKTPLGKLYQRERMKILLIGVGWNRCSALHTAETFAENRRLKTRRFKTGGAEGSWIETPDVADDLGRLFPAVGQAFEQTGAVTTGRLGDADCRVCDLRALVDFASAWINRANLESGDRA